MTTNLTQKRWEASEIGFIRNNLHLTDEQLADHFGVSASSISKTRSRYKITKYQSKTKDIFFFKAA